MKTYACLLSHRKQRANDQRRVRKQCWTDHETNYLLHCIGGDKSIPAIAVALGRTEKAIRAKMRREGYTAAQLDGFKAIEIAKDLRIPVRRIRYLVTIGLLESQNGRITEASFRRLLQSRPEEVPIHRLARETQFWLEGYGYSRIILEN